MYKIPNSVWSRKFLSYIYHVTYASSVLAQVTLKINKDDIKMDAIAHFHMRLDFNINGPRDFNFFNFKLVLPLHIVTTKEF